MNKNTLFAFLLIMAGMAFFLSPTYEKMYKKITGQKQENTETDHKNTNVENQSKKEETKEKTEVVEKIKSNEPSMPVIENSTLLHSDTVWIETEKLIAGIDAIGARIVSIKMKNYRIDHLKTDKESNEALVELVPYGSVGGCGTMINTISYDREPFNYDKEVVGNKATIKGNDSLTIRFTYTDSIKKSTIEKRYSFYGTSYKIALAISSNTLQNNKLTLSWMAGINESEENKIGFYQTEERKVSFWDGHAVGHIKATKLPPTNYENPESGAYRWIGVASKYFFIGMIADTNKDADLKVIAFEDKQKAENNGKKNKTKWINYAVNYQYIVDGEQAKFWIYAGPSKYQELKKYHLEFEQILFPVLSWARVFFWSDKWFPPLAEFVLWLLLGLFKLTKDYGIAIILLTILSKVVTYPLTQSSMKSMNRMRDLQPKINALRNKHKNNPKKMNEEIMALYKAEGVNPLNPGCLPMFLQMPIFISLFIVLQRAIELRGAATIILPWVHDLSKPEMIFMIPGGGIPLYGSNFAILPIIMAILTFFQNKMTIKDPNQKAMIYFMPIFMLVLFNGFPSGLVLYWTMQSALGLVQQFYTDRKNKIKMQQVQTIKPTVRKK